MNELTEIKLENYRQSLDCVKGHVLAVGYAYMSLKNADTAGEWDEAMGDLSTEIQGLQATFKDSQKLYSELVGQLEHPRKKGW